MRAVEAVGIARFGRMSYSYLYHPPTRTWYEGAGQTVGAHTGGRNSRALGLSIIGNTNDDPMPHLVEDAAWLIRHLIHAGKLAPVDKSNSGAPGPWGQGYPTGGHRDQKATACPGRNAYALIGQIRAAVKGAATRPTTPTKPPAQPGGLTVSEAAAIRKEQADYHKVQNQWVLDRIAEEARRTDRRDNSIFQWVVAKTGATDTEVAEMRAELDRVVAVDAPAPTGKA